MLRNEIFRATKKKVINSKNQHNTKKKLFEFFFNIAQCSASVKNQVTKYAAKVTKLSVVIIKPQQINGVAIMNITCTNESKLNTIRKNTFKTLKKLIDRFELPSRRGFARLF